MTEQTLDSCIIWGGYIDKEGYGRTSRDGTYIRAHRKSYEEKFGKIPNGLVLDHLCRNRACINPDHLEAVTDRVNILRGNSIAAFNAKKTHCNYGHELSDDNIAPYGKYIGRRICLLCLKRRRKECYNRKAEKKKGNKHV